MSEQTKGKKVEGFVFNDTFSQGSRMLVLWEEKGYDHKAMPATLVIGEKAYTESEVRDLLVAARRVQSYFDREVTGEYESAMRRQLRSAIEQFEKGITL